MAIKTHSQSMIRGIDPPDWNVYATPSSAAAMKIKIELDADLLNEALALTGARTKREVVHLALQELVRSRKKKSLVDLAGRVRFTSGFDHKALRKLRG
jgi:Arc/MetJ family transcription regulator